MIGWGQEWLSKLSGVCRAQTFGGARGIAASIADKFDVVHDNQTPADGILDLQRAGLR
ncbi:MAG: hypothetical protein CM15mP25_0650 [Gammaproteobacteria bacterium]|nr:MAG: hypothetical protein CM15mP25_0650 [Gammaproteobacteria bacterium]